MAHEGSQSLTQTDTTPRAWRRYVERLRETPARERLERALQLSRRTRDATWADIKNKHPGASERELKKAFLRRVYGSELAARVFR